MRRKGGKSRPSWFWTPSHLTLRHSNNLTCLPFLSDQVHSRQKKQKPISTCVVWMKCPNFALKKKPIDAMIKHILLLLFVSFNALASNDSPLPLPDSLVGRLKEHRKTDVARAEALDAAIGFYDKKERILDAQGYIQELSSLANDLKDNYYIALSDYYIGYCELEKHNYAASINKLNEAYRRAEMLRLTDRTRLLLGRISLTKSSGFLSLNMFPEGFETLERGLDAVDEVDLKLRGRLLNNLGNLHADIGNSQAALEAYKNALKGEERGWYHYNIATVYSDMGYYDSALMYLDSAMFLSTSLDDSLRAKQLKGVIYNKQKLPQQAEQCFEECMEDLRLCENPELILVVNLNNAYTALQNKDFEKAMQLENNAEVIAHELQEERKVLDCLGLKALILKGMGEFEESLTCILQYDSIRESILSRQDRNKVHEIAHLREITALEQQFEVERKVAKQRMRYMGVIALLTIVLVLTIVFFLVKNKRQKELLLKQELDLRNREVTSKTMSQMQTNEVLNEVIEKLTHLANNPKGVGNPLPTAIRELKSRVDDGAKTDFDYYFVQVHPDFYAHLKRDFPDLSKNELRLCALIRANLNIKEIANLNNVSIDSVKSSRKRLRKSLGIVDSNVDLVDFLSMY